MATGIWPVYVYSIPTFAVAHIASIASIARKIKSIYRSDWNVQDNVLMAFSESIGINFGLI